MSTKPTYLGLLNAIAVGELGGEALFDAWAATSTDPDVACLLRTVARREGEHARSFAKRIDELGFTVLDRPDPTLAGRIEIASCPTISDREKLEQLGFAGEPSQPDGFARFFDDPTIDIDTGALLGRYLSEERDTGRRLRACHAALLAAEPAPPEALPMAAAPDTVSLVERLDRIECAVAAVAQCLADQQAAGSKQGGKKNKKKSEKGADKHREPASA
jgi:hypothetical protein